MFLNQQHHKIFTNLLETVPQCLNQWEHPVHTVQNECAQTYLPRLLRTYMVYTDNTIASVLYPQIQTHIWAFVFVLKRKFSRKHPLRERHSFIHYFFSDEWEATADSGRLVPSLLPFLRMTRLSCHYKSSLLQFPCGALTPPEELFPLLHHPRLYRHLLHSTAGLDHRKCPPDRSGQRMVSLHSRLCSGELRRAAEALVVCGRHLGRRVEGDELKAPQLWRWRSSCPCFLGLPVVRWLIICTTMTTDTPS